MSALPRESKVVGKLVFIQGMTGRDERGDLVTGLEAQTALALDRVHRALRANGLELEHIGRARIYLRDPGDWRRSIGIVDRAWGEHGPPVTVLGVGLADPAALVEIEVDACRR